MPTYEYLCKKCKKRFEMLLSMTEHDKLKKKQNQKCPKCGSLRVEQQISSFQVKTSRKS